MRISDWSSDVCSSDLRAPERRGLAIGVFALASANTLEEKQAGWEAWCDSADLFAEAWRDGVERAAERHLAKGAAQLSIKAMADRIGFNLARRSVFGLGLVPRSEEHTSELQSLMRISYA